MRSKLFFACLLLPSLASAQSTVTTISANPLNATAGTPISLSATVTGTSIGTTSPTGTVTFLDGTTTLGSGTLGIASVVAPRTTPASQIFGSLGISPGTPIAGDINGDGKSDVVFYTSTAFQVALNKGNGAYTLAPVQNYVLSQPTFLDYDHDGKTDIVSLSGNALQFLKGDGAGGFAAPVTLTGFSTSQVVDPSGKTIGLTAFTAVDLRGIGRLDLVVGEVIPVTTSDPFVTNQAAVSTYLNNGDGTFTLASTVPTGDQELEGFPAEVVALQQGNFTTDHKAGVIATVHDTVANGSTLAHLMPGYGDGTLHTPSATVITGSCKLACQFSFASGNFTTGGSLDLAATFLTDAGYPAYSIVLPGNGDGTFQPPQAIAIPKDGPSAIIAIDLDGDGKTDLVDALGDSYLSNGDYTFTQTTNLVGSSVTSPLLAADFTGDGLTDIYFSATSSAGVPLVLLGQRGSAGVLTAIKNFVAGAHTVKAVYNGSGSYSGSTSSPLTVTISSQTPTIVATVSPSSALVTQAVTISAKVSAANLTPTGNLTFTQGSTILGTASLDATGTASIN